LAVAPSSSNSAESGSQAYLPDFCATSTVFVVVLVAALVAIVLTLAGTADSGRFLFELSKTALFVLWLSLLGCALMCMLRSRLEGAGKTRAFVFAFLILLAMCVLLAEIAYQLTRVFAQSVIIHDSHAGFLFRTFMVSAIVIALGMRYLYVSSEWRRSIVLEAQARISALQALIRPHFLFNSMNTIASLTRSDPRQAEEAVEDLADLLRANLNTAQNRTTLKQELETAAIYQRIEKLRLGDRLRVRWDVDDLPMRALIPSLTIQPLLENAIYHGIEQLPDGGEVSVTGKRDGKDLVIAMSNPVATGTARSTHGNKMAMDNIRQRFELAYGSRASVSVSDENDRYSVSLRFPLERTEA
jgi:two-component system sensor histidine kinase AlgZ